MSQGAWVLLIVVGLASAFGLWRAIRDGRFRGTHQVRGVSTDRDGAIRDVTQGATVSATDIGVLAGTHLGRSLGERATLLQFSSAFCAPCRATRRTLSEIAEVVPGVVHVEVDAEHHLELVRRLGVMRTPTTLILDAQGREATRATGAPRKTQVLAGLQKAVSPED